jgi:RND family efflux transporter MFP subunit
MKNKISVLALTLAVSISACQNKAGTKEDELAELKKKQSELQAQIATLESDLKAQGKLQEKAAVAVPVTVEPLKAQTFNHYLETQGRIDFDQNVGVSAKVPGVLTSVRVERGDRVSKGQTLATIDASVLEQSMAELKTGWDLANTMFEKQKRLWDQKIGTEIQYLQAKNNKESLERRLATLRQQQAQFIIKAPISGVVDEVLPKVGEAVSPGLPVTRIVNPSGLKVVADISEANASKVNPGDEALVSLPDLNQELPAKVAVVSRAINPASRAFPVEFAIQGGNNISLRPNMIAVVKVKDYTKTQALVVPVNVVQRDETGPFVYIAMPEGKQQVVRKKKVQTGLNYGGQMEITQGLQPNDNVITAGYQSLNEGQIVTFKGIVMN